MLTRCMMMMSDTLLYYIFAGINFRGFRDFAQIRENKFPRNFSKQAVRENKFPRNFSKHAVRERCSHVPLKRFITN